MQQTIQETRGTLKILPGEHDDQLMESKGQGEKLGGIRVGAAARESPEGSSLGGYLQARIQATWRR